MKTFHIKVWCNVCGKMLHHERVDRKEGEQDHYIGLTIEPFCEDCLATLLIKAVNAGA